MNQFMKLTPGLHNHTMYLVRSVDPGAGVYPSIRFPAMVSPAAAAIAGIVKLAADSRLDLREARLPTLGTPFGCWGVEILLKSKDKELLTTIKSS